MKPLSLIRIGVVAASGLFLAGCSLPYAQLSLPGPIAGPAPGTEPALATKRPPTPLAAPGSDATDANRIYPGHGSLVRTGEQVPGAEGASPAAADVAATNATSEITPDGITINLVDASVPEVAKTVLGDVLGVNYVVSEKADAKITLRTVRPVSKDGLLEIFEAALGAEGIAVVAAGGVYKVVPSAEAAAGGAPLRARSGKPGQPGVATEVIPLRYVAAGEMERILKSAAPKAAVLRADGSRNVLLVSGTRTELQSMRELIDVFDVDWMRGMSFGLFPIETSDTDAIAQELDVIFANDKESPSKGIVRFIPNRRLKSILVISSRPEYLKKAQTWIARIDHASKATEKQVFVYHVQHRSAAELAQLAQKVYRSTGQPGQQLTGGQLTGAPTDITTGAIDASAGGEFGSQPVTIAPPVITAPGQVSTSVAAGVAAAGAASAAGGAIAPSPQPLEPGVVAPADAADPTIGGGLPPDDRAAGISIVADETNNSLVITATAAEYRRVSNMLRTLDIAANQVMIEATIAEVTLNDDLRFGVRWFFEKGGSKNVSFTDSVIGATSQVFPGFSYFLQFTDINVALRALSSVTDVNMVSTPTLMTVENKKASLQIGDEVPVATQSAVTVQNPGAPIVNSVTFRNTGVILGITPRVSDNGTVVLEIEQEVSDAKATDTSLIDSPTIQQRRVKTTVAVRDGQTILLAGFIQDKTTRGRTQVPILGDLPYVGNAFKSKNDTITRTELLIAITPQVVRDERQIDDVTSEFRDKLNFSTRPQRDAPPDRREQFDRLVR